MARTLSSFTSPEARSVEEIADNWLDDSSQCERVSSLPSAPRPHSRKRTSEEIAMVLAGAIFVGALLWHAFYVAMAMHPRVLYEVGGWISRWIQ